MVAPQFNTHTHFPSFLVCRPRPRALFFPAAAQHKQAIFVGEIPPAFLFCSLNFFLIAHQQHTLITTVKRQSKASLISPYALEWDNTRA